MRPQTALFVGLAAVAALLLVSWLRRRKIRGTEDAGDRHDVSAFHSSTTSRPQDWIEAPSHTRLENRNRNENADGPSLTTAEYALDQRGLLSETPSPVITHSHTLPAPDGKTEVRFIFDEASLNDVKPVDETQIDIGGSPDLMTSSPADPTLAGELDGAQLASSGKPVEPSLLNAEAETVVTVAPEPPSIALPDGSARAPTDQPAEVVTPQRGFSIPRSDEFAGRVTADPDELSPNTSPIQTPTTLAPPPSTQEAAGPDRESDPRQSPTGETPDFTRQSLGDRSLDTSEAVDGSAPEVPTSEEMPTVQAGVPALPQQKADAPGPYPGPDTSPPRQTIYRDRRGNRRAGASSRSRRSAAGSLPAELLIRLALHPIRRTVGFSIVLMRPDGFPNSITLATEASIVVQAYDDRRYDDSALPTGIDLLGRELRIRSLDGFHWLRSARRVQVFSAMPHEPDLISVSAVRAHADHAILCGIADLEEVRRIASLAGSGRLVSHDTWPGVPAGCAVLSEYRPVRAVAGVESSLRPLDPGASVAIELTGGLLLGVNAFAQGHPPTITIDNLPDGAAVSIGGQNAARLPDGSWMAADCQAPGRHVIDVVPGPSRTYEIVRDPDACGGWRFFDARPQIAALRARPWELAEICGARVVGPSGTTVVAAARQMSAIALDTNGIAVPLTPRIDVPVSVGVFPGQPSFLVSASGPRRNQGRILWLGRASEPRGASPAGRLWVDAMRSASSRRLPMVDGDPLAERAWRQSVELARREARKR